MPRTPRHPRSLHSPAALLALLVVVALVGACGGAEKRLVGSGYLADDVQLEGVERFDEDALLRHLYAGETSWVPLTPDVPHDDALLAVDRERIEALYASYGYHDARVLELRVDERPDDEEVDLFIAVDEGEPTRIETIDVTWEGEVPDDVRQAVMETMALEREAVLEVAALNDALGAMRSALLVRGYPLATTWTDTRVDRVDRAATVDISVAPGPWTTVGAVRFEGLEEVPEYLAQVEVEFALGETWTPAVVAQIEASLRSMRVFRWVSARTPTVDHVDGDEVTVVVRLSEADPQSVRLGAEIELDTARWQQQARAQYTHTNLFGHLTRLDLDIIAGYAELPNPWTEDALHGPVVEVAPTFTKKGLLEKHLTWALTPSFELDLQEGYQFWAVANRLSVARWFGGVFRAGLAHNLRRVDFFNLDPELESGATLLGRDFRDPFLLSDVETRLQAFFVDSITDPSDGVILDGLWSVSSQYVGSDFDFQKFVADIKAYWTPTSWFQIAARTRGGIITTFGNRPGTPFSRRFYLGGANTVRGWGTRRLAPRIEECDAESGDCDSIPVGGYTMVQANLEFRFNIFGPVILVAFADMGDVQRAELTWVPNEFNFAAGPGLRVDTPLGLVRLDFGYRLNDPGVYDEAPWGIYFGFGNSF